MFVKTFFFVCCFTTGVYTQGSCFQVDFNDQNALNAFESCEDINMLGIKSYKDAPIESYRNYPEFYLSNIQSGWSCISTTQTFNLDINTEMDLIIYLNSEAVDSDAFVEIQAFDTEGGDVYTFGIIDVSGDWNIFHAKFSRSVNNAKVSLQLDAGILQPGFSFDY